MARAMASWLGVLALMASASGLTQAPEHRYPSQPVRIVVPLSAGSVTDILSRSIADKLPEVWQQPVIVENRPGIFQGTGSAARSAPDGYTLVMVSNAHVILRVLNKDLTFDPVRDFAGVTPVAAVPFILIASPALPASTVQELVALARARPGTLNMASPGLGTSAHIAGELFRQAAAIDVVNIPYRGAPEAHQSVLRGDAHMFFSAVNIGAELIRAGKVRPLAVSTIQRLESLPEIPTLAEAGVPNFDYNAWFGLLAPAGTPRPIIEKLNRDIAAVLQTADVRTRLERQGLQVLASSADQFDALIRADAARLGEALKAAGIGK